MRAIARLLSAGEEQVRKHSGVAPLNVSGPVAVIPVKGNQMTTWAKDELRKITQADDLHIAPFRGDGVTYGTPTWIWSVGVDDALYVHPYNGRNSRWYRAAMRQKAGRIIAAGHQLRPGRGGLGNGDPGHRLRRICLRGFRLHPREPNRQRMRADGPVIA